MSEFQKVETVEDLATLDQDAVLAGYRDGWSGAHDEPGSDKCRGYWHGWRNAMADQGRIPQDAEMGRLVRAILGPRVNAN